MPSTQLRHESHIAVHLVLRRRDKVLLARRANTGYQDGKYSLVAGHIEGRESLTSALRREALEEIGVRLSLKHIRMVHLIHRLSSDKKIYLDIFFACDSWSGEPTNLEPRKCDDLSWHSVAKLPRNIVPHVRQALRTLGSKRSTVFVELGFKSKIS